MAGQLFWHTPLAFSDPFRYHFDPIGSVVIGAEKMKPLSERFRSIFPSLQGIWEDPRSNIIPIFAGNLGNLPIQSLQGCHSIFSVVLSNKATIRRRTE